MQAQSSSYANAIPYNGGGGGGGLGWGGMLMTHPHHDAMMEFGWSKQACDTAWDNSERTE